jgi:hypothetical protein
MAKFNIKALMSEAFLKELEERLIKQPKKAKKLLDRKNPMLDDMVKNLDGKKARNEREG